MAIIVQKFGGSSVADPQKILAAARKAIRAQSEGNQVVMVVSAMGDTTDDLLALAGEITDVPEPRELDMLLTAGERISMALLAMALEYLGVPAVSFTGSQAGILTDDRHAAARRGLEPPLGQRLREVFELFEQRTQLLQLMDLSMRAQGVQIFIGADNPPKVTGVKLRNVQTGAVSARPAAKRCAATAQASNGAPAR